MSGLKLGRKTDPLRQVAQPAIANNAGTGKTFLPGLAATRSISRVNTAGMKENMQPNYLKAAVQTPDALKARQIITELQSNIKYLQANGVSFDPKAKAADVNRQAAEHKQTQKLKQRGPDVPFNRPGI